MPKPPRVLSDMTLHHARPQPDPPPLVVFTDLDGTLLDHDTYGWEPAARALARCRDRGVPVVMVSSKTRAELERIREELGLCDPFVSENGGGVYFPVETHPKAPPGSERRGNLWAWPLGTAYGALVRALREIRRALGWDIRGFSDMEISEIVERTGLPFPQARLAAQREYDEPFVVEPPPEDLIPLQRAVSKRGLRLSLGGRFFHLHGENDKGRSVDRLLRWYGSRGPVPRCVALGDSPNDFPMLERADVPVLVRSAVEIKAPGTLSSRLTVTRAMGPRGWSEALLPILEELKERKNG